MSVQATLPNTIANGDTPDATPLMANFNFLAAGKGIACGTYADLKTAAQSAPTVPFIAFATDLAAFVGYCGDTTKGDAGFVILGGAAGTTTEVG